MTDADMPEPADMRLAEWDAFHAVIDAGTVALIGLYKIGLGIEDEDTEQVRAWLAVNLAEVVGP